MYGDIMGDGSNTKHFPEALVKKVKKTGKYNVLWDNLRWDNLRKEDWWFLWRCKEERFDLDMRNHWRLHRESNLDVDQKLLIIWPLGMFLQLPALSSLYSSLTQFLPSLRFQFKCLFGDTYSPKLDLCAFSSKTLLTLFTISSFSLSAISLEAHKGKDYVYFVIYLGLGVVR